MGYHHFLSHCFSVFTSWIEWFPAKSYHWNSQHPNQSSIHNCTFIDWGSPTRNAILKFATQFNRIDVIPVTKLVKQHQQPSVTRLSSPPFFRLTNHDSNLKKVSNKSTPNIENSQRVLFTSDFITTASKVLEHYNL